MLKSASAMLFAALAPSLLAAQPAQPPAVVALPTLSAEQQALLRCSVAMAMAAERQRTGQAIEGQTIEGEAPDLTVRGREFFVRSLAQLMDETGAGREAITRLARDEATALNAPGALGQALPPCLIMLELSGL